MVFANLTTADEPICGPPKDDPAFVGITVYGEQFYPQNHVGRGWGIRNGAMGAGRLPKIIVLTIDDFCVGAAAALPGVPLEQQGGARAPRPRRQKARMLNTGGP